MSNRRSPWLTLTVILVYGFLYLPIVTLIVFAFNSSRQNVVFEFGLFVGKLGRENVFVLHRKVPDFVVAVSGVESVRRYGWTVSAARSAAKSGNDVTSCSRRGKPDSKMNNELAASTQRSPSRYSNFPLARASL